MIFSNDALRLATGSPANGGIIIPEHFKAASTKTFAAASTAASAAALAAAETVRHGLCKSTGGCLY
jgi:beta-lactamase class A